MAVTRWDPFTVIARVDDDFEGLVRRTWGNTVTRTAGYVPAVDMISDGTDAVIKLELPGLDITKDVEVEVHNGRLTISGERHEIATSESARTLVRELRYGAFRRDFALPENVSADDIVADYQNGVLVVRVKNVTKPLEAPRKIEIKSDGSANASIAEGSVVQAA
jgi:HSP20 family protein